MAVPTIQSVYLNGADLTVYWAKVADAAVTQYVVTVFYGTDTVFSTKSFTAGAGDPQWGTLSLPGGVPGTSASYFVQVSTMWSGTPGQGETSQLVPLITRLPVLETGFYDGTDFHLEWEPSDQASQGYYFQIYSSNSGARYGGTASTASDWWGTLAGTTLTTGLAWMLQVSATGTVASDGGDKTYAAQAATALPTTLPSLAGLSASYRRGPSGSFIGATWTALDAATGMTRYRLQAYGPDGTPGTHVDVAGVTSTSGTLALPEGFEPGSTLRLLALNDSGIGVGTTAQPVLMSQPVLAAVAFAADNASVNVAWSLGPDAGVTGYTVEIYNAAHSYQQTVTGAGSRSVAFANLPTGGLDASQSWGIRVWATGASGTVPAVGDAWPLPAAAPTLTALACQGTELDVSWSLSGTAAQPAAYVIGLTVNGATAANVRVEGGQSTQARLRVPDSTKTYGVTVAAVGPGLAQGPFSTAATPLVAQATGLKASTSSTSGLCTLSWSWTGAGTPTAYRLEFSDGSSATSNSATYAFASPLPVGADLSVSLSATGSSAGASLSGPSTLPHALFTQRAVASASFDAAAMTATATWSALAGATGYRVALMANASGTVTEVAYASAAAGATQATVAFPTDYALNASTQYTMLVQGQWGNDLGLASDAASIFVPGFHTSTSSASTAPPFTYPATLITTTTSADDAMAGQPLSLYLPDVSAGTGLTGLPLTQGAFTLAANTDATRNKAVYPYVLNISNTVKTENPWVFTAAETFRTGLADDVQTFLTAVETAGAVPWGMTLIQQALARLMPQTFAEQLYYNFGLTFPGQVDGATQGSVDLRPGMVLRVVPNPYQTVAGQTSGSWLTGYVGAACIDYDVGSLVSATGAWSAGFDSFIGQLVGSGALTVSAPVANTGTGQEQGIAEAADLYFPAFTQSFYRLFVPSSLLSPSGTGSITASDNFVLAAASSYAGLCSATSAPSAQATVAYFRGRAVLKACLRITLDGAGIVVPVGTTLANLLAPAVPPPLAGVRIERGLGGAVLDPTLPSNPASLDVHLDWQASGAAAYGPGWGVASLPLLPGDRITLS
jgi:hypothetical protein